MIPTEMAKAWGNSMRAAASLKNDRILLISARIADVTEICARSIMLRAGSTQMMEVSSLDPRILEDFERMVDIAGCPMEAAQWIRETEEWTIGEYSRPRMHALAGWCFGGMPWAVEWKRSWVKKAWAREMQEIGYETENMGKKGEKKRL